MIKVIMTGINVPKEFNACCVDGCKNGASTAVYQNGMQINICAWHFKNKLESKEWFLGGIEYNRAEWFETLNPKQKYKEIWNIC